MLALLILTCLVKAFVSSISSDTCVLSADIRQFSTWVCKKLFHGYLKNKSNSTGKVPIDSNSFNNSSLLDDITVASSFVTWSRVLPNGGFNVPTVVTIGVG